MFVTGTFFASLAGLLTGIPLFPGVIESDDTRSIVALIGIALFLLAFEVAMASSFFVLAQILFPEDSRALGSSFTNAIQFMYSILINTCFPIAVQALSGGPSGDQNKGMGISFSFFGVCGLVSWAVLYKYMDPYEGDNIGKREDVDGHGSPLQH